MIYWNKYIGHEPKTIGKRKFFDNNIYTFDIETTSYLILNGNQLKAIEYLELSNKEKEECKCCATMYIWMFSINDVVYYGRTWEEFRAFLNRLNTWGTEAIKIVYVHNLSFEFQFLRNVFKFKSVYARKSHKVMKAFVDEFKIEFRCTYFMSNAPLKKLSDIYDLKVQKMVGDLDYNKIRHSETYLSDKELKYCENDCLVLYEYILKELESYDTCKNTPLTSTGHVRRELKEKIEEDYKYKNKTRKAINTDGHIYNLLVESFQRRIYAFKLDLHR